MKKVKWIMALILVFALALAVVSAVGILMNINNDPPDPSEVVISESDVYVPYEVLAPAESLEHAQKIADTYGLELKSYSNGIAVFIASNPEKAVEASEKMEEDGIPPLSLNMIYDTTAVAEKNYFDPRSDVSFDRSAINSLGIQTALDIDQWHHDEMDNMRAWEFTTGENVVVAVIDTGIDVDHPAFAGRISKDSYNSYTDEVGLEYVRDDYGHGTHVSGIIAASFNDGEFSNYGVAPDAEIMAIKANFTGEGWFDTASLLRGINYAADNGADIINMSLGRSYFWGEDELERLVLANAVKKGVTIVCAAGNSCDDHAGYPAAYPETIAVSATRKGYAFDSGYSNSGPEIDVAAPGTNIYSAANGGGFIELTGTSMASPNVAGVAALIKSLNPEYTPDQVRRILHETAQDAGPFGVDDYYGYGIVSAYAVVLGPDALLEVTYEFNDDMGGYAVVKAAPGSRLIEPEAKQVASYVFDGWYVSEFTLFYFSTDRVEHDMSLYAGWVEAEAGMYAVEFPDSNFRHAVLRMLNDNDGEDRRAKDFVTTDDADVLAEVTVLFVSYMNIRDMTGLHYFSGLTELYCYCNQLTTLDVSKNIDLVVLDCDYNYLTELDVSNNAALEILWCCGNELTELDVSNNTALKEIWCYWNQLTKINASNNPELLTLVCSFNELAELDISNCIAMTELFCSYNQLTELDVSGNSALKYLECNFNQLTSLDLYGNPELLQVNCDHNRLTDLNVSNNRDLVWLSCEDNQLGVLDVSNNLELTGLFCYYNSLTELDVSSNIELEYLSCGDNLLTALDVSRNINLGALWCYDNRLDKLNVSKNFGLYMLDCSDNKLSALDVSNNSELGVLSCRNNQLKTLDVSNNPWLWRINCYGNKLTKLDVSNNPELWALSCEDNQLKTLDVSNSPWLGELNCAGNQLTKLDVSNNPELWYISCENNQLKTLDVSKINMLWYLNCSENKMSSPDSVIGWQNHGLILDENFIFYPQNDAGTEDSDPDPDAVLESIKITKKPSKTAYTVGDKLDLSGMVVTATYSDGSSRKVSDVTADPANGEALDSVDIHVVRIEYTENGITKSDSITITVNNSSDSKRPGGRNPKTGDNRNIYVWTAIGGLSIVSMISVIVWKKRLKTKSNKLTDKPA